MECIVGTQCNTDADIFPNEACRIWPLSNEHGTYKPVEVRFWRWLSGESPQNLLSCSLFIRTDRVKSLRSSGDMLRARPEVAWKYIAQVASALHPPPSTLHPQPSTLNPQHSTLNTQPSTIDPQHSTLNTQFSTLITQHSTLKPEP